MGVNHRVEIYGLREADEKHEKMVSALKACQKAGVEELPKEITAYFGVDPAYDSAELVAECVFPEHGLQVPVKTTKFSSQDKDVESSYTVKVEDIPKDIKQLLVKLVCSY